MKAHNSFSSHHSSSKQVKLFNPNSSKVDQDLSRIKTILTKHLMPTSFNNQVEDAFSQLYSKIPQYESSLNLPESSRVGDFDPFWNQWLKFREQISKLTDQSIIFFYQEFMNERFDEFNEILEDIFTKPPQKVPLYREYEKSKKEIQTSFENLQQILLEQFDVDLDDEDDDKTDQYAKTQKQIETIIKNLQSQRSKIRQIKKDVENKHKPFFTTSSQDKDLSEKQHQRCIKIIDEILVKINGLPKQYHQFNSINSELSKAEEKIKANFPPNKVQIPPFESKTASQNDDKLNIEQIDLNGQITQDEEEELFEEEEEEVFLEEELEYEEDNDNNYEEQPPTKINHSKSQFQSPIKNANMKKTPLTPPPTSKNPFTKNVHDETSENNQKKNLNQKKPATPQKKPPRLQITSTENGSIDDSDTFERNSQKTATQRPPPQSAKAIQKLPHIKPLNLEDDALVDTFHGLSFSFSSSSSSSSDDETNIHKRKAVTPIKTNKPSVVNHRNKPTIADAKNTGSSEHLSYRLTNKRTTTHVDPSVHNGGTRSGGSWRNDNGENQSSQIKTSHKIETVKNKAKNDKTTTKINNDVDDDDDVFNYQPNKQPSSPRRVSPQPSHLQPAPAKMRSKSPSASIIKGRIINSRNSSSSQSSSSDDSSSSRRFTQRGRPNSSLMTNQPVSPAKKHLNLQNQGSDRFNSFGGNETDSAELLANTKGEFNTQPSVPISPVRSHEQTKQHVSYATTAIATSSTPVKMMQQQRQSQGTNTMNSTAGEGMRQQVQTLTKEKEGLQIQVANMKGEIEQLKDDYQTIVVQLQIAYEENKESLEETSNLKATIDKMSKEKETMGAKIKDLQLLLLQTPVFDSSDKTSKRDLPEKLKKLGSSDSNSDDDDKKTFGQSNKSPKKTKAKKKVKKDTEKEDSDDGDLNKTILMYQAKLKNLMHEKEVLYDNINKLADDNAHLKEQLTTITSQSSLPTIDQPFYVDQLKLLEEDQEYFTEELQRVWKSYDSLLARLSSKSKDDSVYFENSKLHKENDKLHSKLIATRKEIQFLKDIRKSSVMSKNSPKKNAGLSENDIEKIELRKKLDDEKRKNEALVKALREEKQKTAAKIVSEDEHRQLFNAKLTIHKLQYELQKVSSKFVHVKGKNKRLKLMMNEKGIQIVKDEMSNEIDAMRDAYESAIDWGYAQQEISIKEQSEKEALALKVKLLEEGDGQASVDSQTEEVLAEMKVKIEEKLKLQHELDVIRELAVEQLNGVDEAEIGSNVSTADLVEKALQANRKDNS